jgi:hypothetical protein
MAKADITPELLREHLRYDPDTGVFVWIKTVRHGGKAKVGDVAGAVTANGRIKIAISKHQCYAHRLVWLYLYGRWPEKNIDHIDGNPSNNRLNNLREASQSQNMQNLSRKPKKSNTSGFIGVSWSKRKNSWVAAIRINGKQTNLGKFPTAELAHAAYCEAKAKHHKFQPVLRD